MARRITRRFAAKAYTPWTALDEINARRMQAQGQTVGIIARTLGRTTDDVQTFLVRDSHRQGGPDDAA